MKWEEIKKELDRLTGLDFSAITATGKAYPLASFNIQEMNRRPVSDKLLSVRVYSPNFDYLETKREELIEALNKSVLKTDTRYIHLALSNVFINESIERGVYDLSLQFILKTKERI